MTPSLSSSFIRPFFDLRSIDGCVGGLKNGWKNLCDIL